MGISKVTCDHKDCGIEVNVSDALALEGQYFCAKHFYVPFENLLRGEEKDAEEFLSWLKRTHIQQYKEKRQKILKLRRDVEDAKKQSGIFNISKELKNE